MAVHRSPASRASPVRAWMFTINKRDGTEPGEPPFTPQWVPETMRYLVFQLESAPTTGRHHYQGYVQFREKHRLAAAKGLLGGAAEISLRVPDGSPEQNRVYCTKLDSRVPGSEPYEYGTMSIAGRSNGLAEAAIAIVSGTPPSEIAERDPEVFVRYHRGLTALHATVLSRQAKSYRIVTPFVLIGPPRCGKTLLPLELWGPSQVYKLNTSTSHRLWFDGYEGQPVLFLDDYTGWIDLEELLIVLEGHPHRLEVKGGFTHALWTVVIITSNLIISQWYPSHSHLRLAPLYARLHDLFDLNLPGELDAARARLSQLPIPHVTGYLLT